MALTPKESMMMATMVERVNNIREDTKSIIKHQEEQKSEISDTIAKLAKTEAIAKSADKKAGINQRWTWGLVLAIIGAFVTIIAQGF